MVPITFSINISQNLFSDPNIISRPCLPNQIQGFLWGPVQTSALREVFLACTPLTILPSFQSLLLSEPVPHTPIPCWQPGLSLQPHFMLESFRVCRKKKWPHIVLASSQICPSGLHCWKLNSLRVKILQTFFLFPFATHQGTKFSTAVLIHSLFILSVIRADSD